MPPGPDLAVLSATPLSPELALSAPNARVVARRAALPVLAGVAALVVAWLVGGLVHPVADAARRLLHVSPGWLAVGAVLESASLAGYVVLLSLVAGRHTRRIGVRESAQITLAGAAATRLLPTAGAGGAALAVWTFRRAGLTAASAGRALLAFFVLLYAVFLAAVAAFGAMLALGVGHVHGPVTLAAIPAGAAAALIALAVGLAARGSGAPVSDGRFGRIRRGAGLVGGAVRDALALVRGGDVRLAGAAAYWCLDAAVLWTMLHAFGAPPSLAVVGLAYFLGQVANTLPLPGSVSGGMAGVLIAFHVPAGLALSAVLVYRTIAVWLPTPAAVAAVPRLRSTVARWATERAPATPSAVSAAPCRAASSA